MYTVGLPAHSLPIVVGGPGRLAHVFIQEGGTPVGIYDAKTELFHWEATRQYHYDHLCPEGQGRLGHHMIASLSPYVRLGPPCLPPGFRPTETRMVNRPLAGSIAYV